jgi:hypothetical protein
LDNLSRSSVLAGRLVDMGRHRTSEETERLRAQVAELVRGVLALDRNKA